MRIVSRAAVVSVPKSLMATLGTMDRASTTAGWPLNRTGLRGRVYVSAFDVDDIAAVDDIADGVRTVHVTDFANCPEISAGLERIAHAVFGYQRAGRQYLVLFGDSV